MIESHSELPAQESGPAKIWHKGRRALGAVTSQIEGWIQALPGSQSAERLKNVSLAFEDLAITSNAREYLTQGFRWIGTGLGDRPLVSRFALHLVVVLLAIGVVGISQVSLPSIDFFLPTPTPAPDLGEHTVAAPPSSRGGGPRYVSPSTALFQAPQPHTTVAERNTTAIITYTVQANDNIWAIAQGFGLKAETVLWANPTVEKSPDLLSVGQVLTILPIDGIYYTVEQGDTVDSLAKKYQTSAEKITSFELNNLEEPYTLMPGQQIVLPDGRKKVIPSNYYPMTRVYRVPEGAPQGSGRFAWPAQGYLSQRYWAGHLAIDIASRTGVPIYAADDGYVVLAGRDTWGYGNQVLIDHGNGFLTRYAHLQQIHVKAGTAVKKNQQIGTMGSTGRSTGPHLHFEVIQAQTRRNPLGYLP